jgi:phosphonate transport system substrate-binding protein
MAPRQTVDFFGPVAASMQAAIGHQVRLESVQTFADFGRAIAKQRYDIALIQPFDYPKVVEELGYIPLAQLAVPLVTQFFVRDNSKYKNLEDLRGTTIAMPPALAANSRMALRALYDNNLIPGSDVQLRYFNSHDSCIQQVWAGKASACGTARPPIQIFEKRMQAKLHAIYDTPSIPHIVFVANSRIPAEERSKLQELIVNWSKNKAGQKLLKNLGFPGFVMPKPAEYTVMRNYDPELVIKRPVAADKKELIMGVFPFISPRRLVKNYALVLPRLSKIINSTVHMRTATNFNSFGEGIAAEVYDIMAIQPFDYETATQHGYLPLAGMEEELQGTFYVLDKSPYKKIVDFKGQVVAMPPVNSAISRVSRYALRQAGLNPDRDVTIDYRNTHGSCLRQVQKGFAATCVTGKVSVSVLPKEISQGLRSVGLTETIPGVVFMVHKRLPAITRSLLQNEILSWKNTAEGKNILKSVGFGNLIPVDENKYKQLIKFD